jgi:hypothetical protein
MQTSTRKSVFTIIEKTQPGSEQKSYWVRIGSGWVNRDGSLNLKLDALPVNGMIHVRDYVSEEERAQRRAAAAAQTGAPLGLAE